MDRTIKTRRYLTTHLFSRGPRNLVHASEEIGDLCPTTHPRLKQSPVTFGRPRHPQIREQAVQSFLERGGGECQGAACNVPRQFKIAD